MKVKNLKIKEKLWNVVKNKIKKAIDPDEVLVKVWKVLRNLSIGWLTSFFNKVLVEEKLEMHRRSFMYTKW